jgi:hypothetical protein
LKASRYQSQIEEIERQARDEYQLFQAGQTVVARDFMKVDIPSHGQISIATIT